jgi:hypothetical protein
MAKDKSEPAKADSAPGQRVPAELLRLNLPVMSEIQPDYLSAADAVRIVHALATSTDNIVVIPYGAKKARMRKVNRRQIELCVQKGTLTEGPFVNQHGHWQMNLYRHAAGEGLTVVVAIEWVKRVLVINAF